MYNCFKKHWYVKNQCYLLLFSLTESLEPFSNMFAKFTEMSSWVAWYCCIFSVLLRSLSKDACNALAASRSLATFSSAISFPTLLLI